MSGAAAARAIGVAWAACRCHPAGRRPPSPPASRWEPYRAEVIATLKRPARQANFLSHRRRRRRGRRPQTTAPGVFPGCARSA